ncbi:hypothetical protein AVEN_214943-1 [Araneus ventricosus]|uniref:Uncharacterized protein n=1 Tax=Araneus ventricosus TaxID=182803 RepID=A0A4Y2DAH3_ARAVE|nr:hypothetical protein AVEN_214943-1 [Araneus ventricosus]
MCTVAPITSDSCDDPPFHSKGNTCHRRSAPRITPPLLYTRGKRDPVYLSAGFSSPYMRCPLKAITESYDETRDSLLSICRRLREFVKAHKLAKNDKYFNVNSLLKPK